MEKAILEVSIIHEVTCSQDPIAVFKIVDEVALVGRSLSLVFAKTFQHTILPLSFIKVSTGKHSLSLATQLVFEKCAL